MSLTTFTAPIAASDLNLDTTSFFVILAVAALAAITVSLIPKRWAPSVVVVELFLGILVGPQVLDLAHTSDFIDFLSNLGLAMLFFFAGYEIDFSRIRGEPIRLGAIGWLLSLLIAYSLGGMLAAAGIVVSYVYTGSALATTAIGTLVPMLRDAKDLKTPFGSYLMAAGAMGEFGPIVLITVVLSTQSAAKETVILLVFVALAVTVALLSVRYAWRGFGVLDRTMETSSQLPVRITVLLIMSLVAVATTLGLDVLLGGFVAGMIVRAALRGREVEMFESKLTALGFGFLIPFFFVHSGLTFNLDALGSPGALGKLVLFFFLFLVVRGTPAMVLYTKVLTRRERTALAFFCATELPLVVAITTIAVDAGHMRTTTAAGLVGAAMLSTLIYPFIGLALRRADTAALPDEAGAQPDPTPA